MAVFLERGIRGSDYNPGADVGNIFLDVPASYWAGGWIELLYLPDACPLRSVTHRQG